MLSPVSDVSAQEARKGRRRGGLVLLGVVVVGGGGAGAYSFLSKPGVGSPQEDSGEFRLAPHEVTVAEYSQCVAEGECEVPGPASPIEGVEGDSAERCNFGRPARGEHPMNCLSRDEAAAYCRSRGGELPRGATYEAAFLRTARPPGGGWANHCENECANPPDEPAPEVQGTCALLACESGDGYAATAPVGQFASRLPGAVADLYGNVAEWTSTFDADGLALVAGSAWSSPWDTIDGALDRRLAPGTRRPDVGFRCVISE